MAASVSWHYQVVHNQPRKSQVPQIFPCKTWVTNRLNSVMIQSSSPASSVALDASDEELPALPIWTFALGVLALLTFGLTSVPAIICGHRALAEVRGSSNRSLGRSVAVTGLVIGYVGAALLGTWIAVMVRYFWAQ